jgi:LmbE family N-acetylglucosaminyl deacetylase
VTVTIISPHRDDAVASAGLLILELVRRRVPVQIVNCFTISDYAPLRKDRAEDVTTLRRREDGAAAARLGDGIRWIDLALIDAPLRLGCSSDIVCDLGAGAVRAADVGALAMRLRTAIANDAFVIAPLAIGNHVDHVVARRAAAPMTHAYYEDLPYVADAEPAMLAELTRPCSPHLTPADRLDEKLTLVRLYESQFAPSDLAAIERHAGTIDGERIWVRATATRSQRLAAADGSAAPPWATRGPGMASH